MYDDGEGGMHQDRESFERAERVAIVVSHSSTLEQVEAYMPQNYSVAEEVIIREDWNEGWYQQVRLVIRGVDVAGWTLDGYVIPRLASGLHFAEEVKA